MCGLDQLGAVVKLGQVRTVFYVWVGSTGWQW